MTRTNQRQGLHYRQYGCIITVVTIESGLTGPERKYFVMNKTELVEVVSKEAEITKVEAQKVVTATLDAIVKGLVGDGKVILPGFGTFETRARSARTGRNPRTGETIKIKATKAPAFKPGKGMKDAVAKKKK